jgi:hypothetical protein
MIYVFTFIGEFGYELLNWQGTLRKWVRENKKEGDEIVVCSRKGLDLMYESADYYLDISQLDSIQNVVADCYTSYVFLEGTGPHLDRKEWKATRTGDHIDAIKNEVMDLVVDSNHKKTNIKWIWSCDYEVLNGCLFGLERPCGKGGIYNVPHNKLNLNNNEYKCLSVSSNAKNIQERMEKDLGFSLNEDYILCQTGFRQGYELSKVRIDHDKIINELKKECKVVLMDFKTFRLHDSFSEFDSNYKTIQVSDIQEQSVLITNAKRCVFFTEGHLRSHTYLPPMFGKDVEVVAAKEMFSFSEAPLDFWNENVFEFGGQMIAKPYEDFIND